jgi:hypothetical protein
VKAALDDKILMGKKVASTAHNHDVYMDYTIYICIKIQRILGRFRGAEKDWVEVLL